MRPPRLLAFAALLAACGPETAPIQECADAASLRICDDEGCRVQACRGDELCDQASCKPWSAASLSADFDLEFDPADPKRAFVRVREGGFPRAFAEQIRFTFGDGKAGWGEELIHRYPAPGVYPVELEVRLDGYRVLRASRTAVVEPLPSDWSPAFLTVNEIPGYINGSTPYRSNALTPGNPADDYDQPFTLLLPDRGFTVDLQLSERPGVPVLRDALELTADVALGGGSIPAGTNLASRLRWETGPTLRVPRASWTVAEAESFPTGRVVLTLRARDSAGREQTSALPVQIVPLTPDIDPFDEPYSWLLRFDMDCYTITGSTDPAGIVRLESAPGTDGVPDFEQELRVLGAQGRESAPGAATVESAGRVGANAIYRALVQDEIVREIRLLYHIAPDGTPRDGIAIDFFVAGRPDAPDPATWRSNGPFSVMRFGGEMDGYFGMSRVSWFARSKVDDTEDDLGVGTVAITRALFGTSIITEAFDDLKPGVGDPVGEHALDAVVLAGSFDRWAPGNSAEANARWDALTRIARFLGLAIGAVAAHEMGHAMGLVPPGLPPRGLFGGIHDCPFIGERSDGGHADYPALNLMQAGGNIFLVVGEFTATTELPPGLDVVEMGRLALLEERLAPLERAYFRRGLTYGLQ